MSKLSKLGFKVLDLMVIFVMIFASPMSVLAGPAAQEATPPTITSDLADYPPGATVILTGANWQGDTTVHLVVDDTLNQSWQYVNDVSVAEDGSISDTFSLPSYFISDYNVTATGNDTQRVATATFTDANDNNVGTYDQCSNNLGTGYTSGDTGCRWINGNLNKNNSRYFEGDATVQRLWLTDLAPGSEHTVTFKYGTTKGGKHAYDFLTTWDWSEDWIALADRCQGITGCTTAAEDALDIPEDPNVPNSFEPSAPGDRQFVMRGGDLTNATTPAIFSGDYGSDSETIITITFTAANSGAMCATKSGVTTCSVAVWFGAHVAAQANWGIGLGAGSIPGSPYHVALDAVDGNAIGQRDNQMQAEVVTVVPNGTIIIIKDAQPNDPQDFSFNLSSSTISQSFFLDDDSDSTLPNTTAPQYSVPPGSYTVQELNIPSGWTLADLVCVDPTNNTTMDVGTATATINLASSETVTCTFVDTRDVGSLKLTKSLSGGPQGYTGPFTLVYDCDGTAYDGSVSVNAGSSQTVSGIPSGTSCTVSEPTLPSPPGGYTFGTPTFSPSATVTIAAGTSVEVTTNNTLTQDTGSLVLAKALTGGPQGYDGPFTINYDCDGTAYDGSVIVVAGSSQTVSGIPTGTSCTISETLPTPPTGYSFGTPTFSPSATVTIPSGSGSSVTVTTNNSLTRDQGYLKITKSFDPKSSGFNGTFDIVYNCGAGDVTVSLAAGNSTTVGPFDTGTSCTVSEPTLPAAPAGWTFGTPSVSGSPATITKGDQAAAVEVTVTNSITRDQGYLKITKSFDPKTSGFNGTFDIVYNCGAGDVTVSLAASGSTTVGPFDTGTSCTVSEPTLPAAPAGWTFGTPSVSGSPATITKGDQAAAVEVTVTNSITRDLGSLVLAKALTGGPQGYTGPFTIHWDCGAFGSGNETVSAGGSATVSNIPTGTSCTVSETPPTPPTGYSFGTPTFSPSATVTIPAGNGSSVTVTTNNTLTRDLGSLVLAKALTGGPQGYTGPFTIHWDCGAFGSGNETVSAGGSATVSNIPTGTSCTVSETPPTPPTGYSFGTPTFSPSATVTIPAGNGSSVTVTTNNTLTRDLGNLKIKKYLSNPDGAVVPASFTVNYNCGAGYTGSVNVAPGSPQTVSGIPTGSTCTVTEVAPAAIPGYTWGTITYTPASVTIDTKDGTFIITVGNSITRDRGTLTIVKKVVNDNGGTATVSAFGVNTNAGSLTFDNGSASGYTTTYTSQTITVVTGTYTLKENDVYGYTEGSWSCTGAAGTVVPAYSSGSVQVGKNENVVCTITNNDQPGTIIVKKIIKPEGSSTSFSFQTTGDGGVNALPNYQAFSLAGGTQNSQTLDAGSYTVKELVPLGWVLTGIGGSTDPNTPYNCTVDGSGGSTGVGDLNTQTASISLKNGDTVTCVFENTGQGVTRTQGFWATHAALANIAWFGGTAFGHTFPGVAATAGIGDNLICGRPIDTLGKLMGGFWSDVSKLSTNAKRSALDQARMQLLQQLLAAELNASAFGSVPISGSFAAWESALCGTNQNAINTAKQQAASFNTNGDSSTFTPGTSADSRYGRSIANIPFWDVIKP